MADIIGYFPATLAVDINTRTPLRDVEAKVYEISDTSFSNPLAITDMTGVPLTGNVIVSNGDGIFPEFRVPSGVTQVILKAGQALTPMTSISIYAEAAVKSAEDAAKFADKAASEAQAGVEAGLASVLAKEDTKQDAQVDWRWALMYAGNREVALGQRSDGSFYPPALGATSFADSSVVELTADQGWDFAFVYSGNREVAFGRRNDGSYFPDSLGGGSTATPVSIHGDSLTAGWVNYTSELSSLLKRTVTARGNGGMTSYWIAARQGGEPARITAPATIPASGSVTVQVAYAPRAASDVTGGSNPTFSDLSLDGVLAGVQGTITFNSTNMTAVFARAASGRTVPVAAGTPFVTGLTARKSYPIIWAGRNNFKSANDALQVVRDIRAMLAWTENPTKAIIMSIPPWVGEPIGSGIRDRLDAVNLAIRDAFPAYYEDTSSRLRSSSLMEAIGVAPTATDLQNIADGYTPQSLRAVLGDGTPDPGHLGANGYKALNIIIRDIYASRGLLA